MPGLYRWPNKHISFGHSHAGWRDEPEEATHNGGPRMRAHARRFSQTHLHTHTQKNHFDTLTSMHYAHITTSIHYIQTSNGVKRLLFIYRPQHSPEVHSIHNSNPGRRKFFGSSEVRVILYVCVHLGNKGLHEN